MKTLPKTKNLSLIQGGKKKQSFWQNPWTYVSVAMGCLVVGGAVVFDLSRQRITAIYATDVSDSAQAEKELSKKICTTYVQQLINNDKSIGIAFAESTEPVWKTTVSNNATLIGLCNKTLRERPKNLGNNPGTSLERLLNRIETAIQIERVQGNKQPILVSIWLQAAEPGVDFGNPNFAQIETEIASLTKENVLLTIVGPTGNLLDKLEDIEAKNPSLKLCQVQEHQECLSQTFKDARQMGF
jgi:hypothetical protein